ncbi:MAG: DUF5658 family protein [Vicinamibacterales bacterium]
MRHWSVFVLVGILLAPAAGLASPRPDDSGATEPTAPAVLVLPTEGRLLALTAARDGSDPQANVPPTSERDPRRAVLSSLHAVTGVVQTWDGMLTMRVLRAGGVEANPLMKPVTRNEGAMLGVKIAAAVATVIGTETLWHDNHRLAAIVTSIVANSAMAMVARHNAQVLARLEGR